MKVGIFSLVLLLMKPPEALPAENKTQPPQLSVTLLVVPEREACRPNGYQSYGREELSNCSSLTVDTIEAWKDRGYALMSQKVPPSEISLGEGLLTILDAYATVAKTNAAKRKSVVMVFDWETFQSSSIVFARSGSSDIPGFSKQGSLTNERRWIHHERADAFLPAYNVRWTLTAGGDKWIFKTGR